MTIEHYLNGPGSGGRRKIGLALSSGMARGWGHIGVIKALTKLGFTFDVIAGCSVGALAGGCYLAGKLDELEGWARSLNKRKIVSYLDMRLRSGGLIGGNRLVEEMRNYIGHVQIEDFGIPYAAMTTDLVTGHEIWLQQGDLVEAMRASFSLPGIFPPVKRRRGAGWRMAPWSVPCPSPRAGRFGRRYGHRHQFECRHDRQVAPAGTALMPTVAGFDMLDILEETEGEKEKLGLMMSALTRKRVSQATMTGPACSA